MGETHWYKNATIYQIYPRSFKDSNRDGIGDLQGITGKLDYLHDLGVDGIWLSPIYVSPMVDGGYDIVDFCDIDPIFGTLADFDRLVDRAHKLKIRVLLDFVPNHTSFLHPWFIESSSSRNSPKRDWYIWKDAKSDGLLPNNWLSVAGGSAWEYHHPTKQFYLHSFLKEQPDLNWRNPQVVSVMLEVCRFWLKRGVDGLRIDAINYLLKDERFLDEPKNKNYVKGKNQPNDILLHIYSKDQPGLINTIRKVSDLLDEFPDAFMVSEIYLESAKAYLDPAKLINFYASSKTISHVPFNFCLIFQPWSAKAYQAVINAFQGSLKSQNIPIYVIGNHDYPRIATRLGGEKQARLAALLQLTLPGTPFLYYGDEIGMKDVYIPYAKRFDKFEVPRDSERTPMQWNSRKHAGFSEVTPWLPVGKDYKTRNIANVSKQKASTLLLYKTLIRLRKQDIFRYGKYVPINLRNDKVMGYLRVNGIKQVLVLLNFSNKKQLITTKHHRGKILCTSSLDREGESILLNHFTLDPFEGCIIAL